MCVLCELCGRLFIRVWACILCFSYSFLFRVKFVLGLCCDIGILRISSIVWVRLAEGGFVEFARC